MQGQRSQLQVSVITDYELNTLWCRRQRPRHRRHAYLYRSTLRKIHIKFIPRQDVFQLSATCCSTQILLLPDHQVSQSNFYYSHVSYPLLQT